MNIYEFCAYCGEKKGNLVKGKDGLNFCGRECLDGFAEWKKEFWFNMRKRYRLNNAIEKVAEKAKTKEMNNE